MTLASWLGQNSEAYILVFLLIVTLELDFRLVVYQTHRSHDRLLSASQLNEHGVSSLMSFRKESTHASNSCKQTRGSH
jgi:hypothetical protein